MTNNTLEPQTTIPSRHPRRFPLGAIVMTPGVRRLLDGPNSLAAIINCFTRHARGDWGDVCAEDRKENELSLQHGFRLLSSYTVSGEKIWVITEADRSATTALLPEEY